VSDGRHDREDDRHSKCNGESRKDKTMGHRKPNLLDSFSAFLLRAIPGEVGSVQNVHAPFDHFDDGNADSGGESKKKNELDKHFSDP
jgi:hypothetical protein